MAADHAHGLDRALYIPLGQPLGRLAFYLLDPRSSDSLEFWGTFHSALIRGDGMWGEPPRFPILAVGHADATQVTVFYNSQAILSWHV